MALGKRKRGPSKSRVVKTAMRVGNWASVARASRARQGRNISMNYRMYQRLAGRVNALSRSIETKEGQWTSAVNVQLPHNNIHEILKANNTRLNPFERINGDQDPMDQNHFQCIGDQIRIKGMKIVGFFEGALQRSKVYFRVMLLKCPRGDVPTRATLFKNDSNNKMIDVVNTERYTLVWNKTFTVSPPNPPPNTVSLTGVAEPGVLAGLTGNRIIKAWIPGYKFGRRGNLQYESQSGTNPKFFDYRFFVLAYDWYGTPQDENNVGVINSFYTKVYFKDA